MKKKKNWIMVLLICLFVFLLLFAGWLLIKDKEQSNYFTTDYLTYGDWGGHIEGEADSLRGGLFVFPEMISNEAIDINYLYVCENQKWQNEYFILLKVKYTEADYRTEVERLSSVKCTIAVQDEEITNKVLYTEEKFSYPSYAAILGCDQSFEYALLDEDNMTIVYVYLQGFSHFMLPREYRPLEYQKDTYEMKNGWENLNIYYTTDKNGDHPYYRD